MTRNRKSILAIYHTLSFLSAAMLFNLWIAAQSSDQAELIAWREQREAQLKADDGWLTVSGLFWLKEGINSVGAAPGQDVRLPSGSAPDQAGQIVFQQGKAVFHVAHGSIATIQQHTIREAVLKSDAEENSHPVLIGDLSLHLIKRGARYGVRLKDKNSLARKHFTKLDWFPFNGEYRLVADFIPYSAPKEVSVVNIIGDVEKMRSPGYVVFRLNGNEYSLEPVTSGKGKLFFIFRDLTSGNETYKPGRFLYADPPVDGKVILDFNKAINPPCSFTAYATCPLPAKRNYLQARIEAGEKVYNAPWHEIAAESRIREGKR